MVKITWRDVLDSKVSSFIDEQLALSIKSKYRYFLWNDRVYKVVPIDTNGHTFQDTKFTVTDIV
jgi:hypothetical protein